MATVFDEIDDTLSRWLLAQPVYFVGTSPLAADGHVNVSPKGMGGTFAVLGPHRVGYLDYFGSGAETIAHLREHGLRSIIVVDVDRVADSCGFSVPLMDHVGDRDVLDRSQERRPDGYFETYGRTRNAESIDGIPAL